MSFKIEGNKLIKYVHEKGTISITIPEGVEIVGSGAFEFDDDEETKSLKEIVLPRSLLVIDEGAFSDLQVERIIIQDGLREIRKQAFYYCRKLKEVYLPETLEIIGESAFVHCKELEKVTIPASVRVLPEGLFEFCEKLKEVYLPETLEVIGASAFWYCKELEKVTIPASVRVLPKDAFRGCYKLKEIILSEGLITIEESVIEEDCEIKELFIPASVRTIKPGAFRNRRHFSTPKLKRITVEPSNENYVTGSDGAVYSKDMKTLIAVPNNCNEKTFIIPDSVTTVAGSAFYGNETISEVVIPSSVIEIGAEAFSYCSHLYMEKITFPNRVKSVGDCAFHETCIYTVVLPITIEKIGSAFYFTNHLRKIEFIDNDSSIEKFNLSIMSIPKSCNQVVIPQRLSGTLHESLISEKSIDVYWTILKSDDPLEIASVMVYQDATEWKKWVDGYGYRANEVVSKVLELLQGEEKISANVAKKITSFATKYADKIDEAVLKKLITELKNRGREKLAESFENSAEVKRILAGEPRNPIEEFVSFHIGAGNSEIQSAIKKGIKYADGSGVSSINAVVLIITQYLLQWSKCKEEYYGRMGMVEALSEGYRLQKDEIADKVAEALDREELMAILEKQAYGRNYRKYIIAFVRYADEKQIEELVKSINARKKSNAKDRWWAQTAENALYLSDCTAAAEYMDKNNMLKQYAKMRGISETDFRDSRMIENFGFDDRGVISFDIGESIIELSITEDAKIQLYDVAEQKIIKNFPKKSGDAQKLAECNEQFKKLKKNIEDFIAKRVEYFNILYLNGQKVTHGVWTKTYLTHPIIKILARLLIWKDARGKLFVVTKDGIVDVNNKKCTPSGDVKLAHILEMKETEIENWRIFLADKKQKQLFAQIWEPLVSGEVKNLSGRYNGAIISNKDRNAFKKAMKLRGINIKSVFEEIEYDYSAGKHIFSNEGTMCIGDYVELEYTVDENTKDLTLGYLSTGKTNRRELNVLVYELDKVCIKAKIGRDEADQIQVEQLDSFNLAQINEFINHAISCKARNCSAMLMNYKNKKYPDFDWLDELVLEL